MNGLDWELFKKHVADYVGMEPEEISESTNLYSDLMIDSLGLFSLGMYLIKQFQVEIPMSSVAVIETVKDIYDIMNNEGTVING